MPVGTHGTFKDPVSAASPIGSPATGRSPAADLASLLSGGIEAGPDFWPRFLAVVADWLGADEVAVFRGGAADADWQVIAHHARRGGGGPAGLRAQAAALAASGSTDGSWRLEADDRTRGCVLMGVPVEFGAASGTTVLAAAIGQTQSGSSGDPLGKLRVAAAVPAAVLARQALGQARLDVERMAGVVDVVAQVNTHTRFLGSAMAFCNALATFAACDRVSLGWRQGGFIRLLAISRMEKFDRRMESARLLETAMDEACDQDEEIVWPPPDRPTFVARDHESFARHEQTAHVCSLPLRADAEPVGVVTCERRGPGFDAPSVDRIRLACDLVASRLVTLRQSDRWFGARWAARLRELGALAVGAEHTWVKLLVFVITLLLGIFVFARVDHRATADFILRSDNVAYVSAPFDGYLAEVMVRPGDAVAAGAPLVKLDTEELELEELATIAELDTHRRTAEKARAEQSLADMRVAEARLAQTQSKLELIRHRLAEATVRSAIDGVVVEGDLRDRIGSAVKLGETLIRVARIDSLYVEARLDERDLHHVRAAEGGEISFVSRPRDSYPIRVDLVQPAAVEGEAGAVFLVRCSFREAPQSWWRPGMSGVCKIHCGKRSLLWITTNRTVDFLRLRLWW